MVLAAERTELTHRGRRRVIGTLLVPAALLWLLAAGGFLLAMDVLYNLQHGVWFASQRGLAELLQNLATGTGTVALFTWTWPRRTELLAGD